MKILAEVAEKLKDNSYLNNKQYCMIPIIPVNLPRDSKPANTFSLAKYGGKINENFERMFNSQQ